MGIIAPFSSIRYEQYWSSIALPLFLGGSSILLNERLNHILKQRPSRCTSWKKIRDLSSLVIFKRSWPVQKRPIYKIREEICMINTGIKLHCALLLALAAHFLTFCLQDVCPLLLFSDQFNLNVGLFSTWHWFLSHEGIKRPFWL